MMPTETTMTAPGKAHRTGITLTELIRLFPDDDTAEAFFADERWPNGVGCPHCGSLKVQSGAAHKTMPYRCRDCRKRFSVKTGTVMEGSNLGYQTWALAAYLLTTNLKGVSSMKLHRDLGITQKSAWHLAHRLRQAWEDQPPQFNGPVEADETFIGGKEGNKHKAQRSGVHGGPMGKLPVAGVKDRETNRVSAAPVERTDGPTLRTFVWERTTSRATVYTDEASAYRGLPREHEAVKHGVGEYVRGQAHTNGIESFWSMLKRGYQGTYHKMSADHLGRYVAEFAGRHNARELDTIDQLRAVVRGMVGKRLRYSDLTA
jgi:transposase-like protein